MLDRFFNLTPDMFFIADFTGELHRVNPAFKKILGYDHQELIARSCFDFVHPDDKASTLKAAEKLIHGESMLNFENRILCKNGDYRWLQWTALPDFEKEVVYGIARDITAQKQAEYDHKKLESQLRQAYKMEAIGTLAGGIAHDFNNILGAVIGYTEMTLSQLPQQDSLARNLQEVLTAGHRARDLVKQILTFSRQAEQQLQPVQVRLIAQEAVKLLRASLPTTIEIRQHIDSDKTVLADPTQVHQIIMNLCTNAGFAMREKGGILGLSLADMVLDGQLAAEYPDLTPGPYLRLTVSDTGRGIPAEIREKIFDPFFTTKAKGEGTGMGLSVVHGIVKSHRGTITVASEPQQGATFQVYLPVIKGGVEYGIKAEESLPGGNEHILFVDDEKPLVDLGQRMLEGIGYRVTTRTSSIEALELFLAQPERFDLVITDMTMPNMTGKELADEILRIRPDIPLVLCTGYSEIITEKRAKALGIRAFLMKPIVLRELAETIRKVLDESIAKSSIQLAAASCEAQDRQFETP
jgi:PAS domain S-box-containing protein